MSNRISLQPTTFISHPEKTETYGYRMYDDYDQTYANTLEVGDLNLPPLEFLAKVKDTMDEKAEAMLDFALEHGMYVSGDWFKAEQIEKVCNP